MPAEFLAITEFAAVVRLTKQPRPSLVEELSAFWELHWGSSMADLASVSRTNGCEKTNEGSGTDTVRRL